MKQSRLLFYLVRIFWFFILVSTTLLLLAAIPARLAQLSRVAPEIIMLSGTLGEAEAAVLAEMGLAVPFYAVYVTFFEALSAFGGVLVGTIIFWRQRHDWMAFFVSIALITLGAFPTPLMTAVQEAQPALDPLVTFLRFIAIGPSMLIFYLFPDGRFVPRWTIIPGALWLAYSASWLIFPLLRPPITVFAIQSAPPPMLLFIVLILCIGFYSQIYRYRHVSSALQRQQTKWVVFGFSIVLLILVGVGIAATLVGIASPSRGYLIFLLLVIPIVLLGLMIPPIAVMFSILKFRLWDIDILIRRTVTYGVLGVLLGIVYVASIILLQQAFASVSGQRSEVITVLSTLAIAALFVPLRNRIQHAIDRRFNRKKYDAQKVLNDFALTVRDETDLEKLTARLMQVVDETMEPKSVSVWLKADDRRQVKGK